MDQLRVQSPKDLEYMVFDLLCRTGRSRSSSNRRGKNERAMALAMLAEVRAFAKVLFARNPSAPFPPSPLNETWDTQI